MARFNIIRELARPAWNLRNSLWAPVCDKKLACALDRLFSSSLSELRDIGYVEQMIGQIGLARDRRGIYGNDVKYMNPVARGLWQIPRQLAEFAVFLSQFKINSLIEIGTYTGYTFTFLAAYLTRFNPGLDAVTVDVTNHKPVSNLWEGRLNARFHLGQSADFSNQAFDLCLIDGDHSFNSVSGDFDQVGKKSKICCFHDINDEIVENSHINDGGVPRFRRQLKAETTTDSRFTEFLYHSHGQRVMGWGVVQRITSASPDLSRTPEPV